MPLQFLAYQLTLTLKEKKIIGNRLYELFTSEGHHKLFSKKRCCEIINEIVVEINSVIKEN